MRARSGAQYVLSAGEYEAEVASVGATLRSLRHRGVDLVRAFDADEVRPAMRGAVLAPWPNRIADGEYDFGGIRHALPLTEPERRTAAHGLVAWMDFTCVVRRPDAVQLSATIEPQPGYPWRVRIDVTYRLTPDGLRHDITATNESPDAAPVGLGGHPYLVAGAPGPRRIDALQLSVPAEEVLLVSPDRLLPTRSVAVAEVPDLDRRHPRALADAEINHAYTAVERTAGIARVTLTDAAGVGVAIEWDERCRWVQIYTDDHGSAGERRQGVAVEPMTCPPDAFRSKRDLASVAPGASVSAGWTIRPVPG
ncbi:aldose 1-epimerase family protein [Microbacterium sp. 179-I 3D3 NHS]|uniref:aldose 1-epimerase family protein n=1 Tax=Microbacterium sp. 179-I 3D3 NHS TaxID=3142382 RepID=UPI0039A2AD84